MAAIWNWMLGGKRSSNQQFSLALFAGLFLGFLPTFLTLQSIFIVLGLFFFRVPWRPLITFVGLGWFLGAFLLDPLFHMVGEAILTISSVQGLFEVMNQMPIVPFTQFNNTVVMGAMLVASACYPAIVFIVAKIRNTEKPA